MVSCGGARRTAASCCSSSRYAMSGALVRMLQVRGGSIQLDVAFNELLEVLGSQ